MFLLCDKCVVQLLLSLRKNLFLLKKSDLVNKDGESGNTINVHWNPSNELRKMSEILILPYEEAGQRQKRRGPAFSIFKGRSKLFSLPEYDRIGTL